MRPAASTANCEDETRLAALLDAVGVLALEVDEAVEVPEDDVEEARLVDAVAAPVDIGEELCVNPPAAARDVVLVEAPTPTLEPPLDPPPEPPPEIKSHDGADTPGHAVRQS